MGVFFAVLFRSRWTSAICLAVVVTALVLPLNGFGVPACQFKMLTRVPCFGCGLTRSFVGMAHLNPARAAFFHPGGVPLFLLVLFLAGLLPAPTATRERLAAWAEEKGRLLTYLSVGMLAFFVLFGIGRMLYVLALLRNGRPSPW